MLEERVSQLPFLPLFNTEGSVLFIEHAISTNKTISILLLNGQAYGQAGQDLQKLSCFGFHHQ